MMIKMRMMSEEDLEEIKEDKEDKENKEVEEDEQGEEGETEEEMQRQQLRAYATAWEIPVLITQVIPYTAPATKITICRYKCLAKVGFL